METKFSQSQTLSFASTIGSKIVPISNAVNISATVVWSGATSPVGTFTVQVSNDGTNFKALDAGQAISGAAGMIIFDYADVGYLFAQVLYTATSGSGSFTVTLVSKGN